MVGLSGYLQIPVRLDILAQILVQTTQGIAVELVVWLDILAQKPVKIAKTGG